MVWTAGVDGFKAQWCVVLHNLETDALKVRIVPTFAGLLTMAEAPEIVAVDIPIGLPEYTVPGGRACEREARRLLGKRASSVFSAVGRAVLHHPGRLEAHIASWAAGGAWGGSPGLLLAAKLQEADAAMSPDRQSVTHEVHPEVLFWAMNDGAPMPFGKKSTDGEHARQTTLIHAGFPRQFIEGMAAPLRVGRDDFLDACAAAWTARRIVSGNAKRLPATQKLDERGLDQAIWY